MDLLTAKRLKFFKRKETGEAEVQLDKVKEEYTALCALCVLLEQKDLDDEPK